MGRPKKPEPSDRLHMPRSVVKRIRRLAAHFDREPGDYVAEKLAPILDKDEAKMLADIAREQRREGE